MRGAPQPESGFFPPDGDEIVLTLPAANVALLLAGSGEASLDGFSPAARCERAPGPGAIAGGEERSGRAARGADLLDSPPCRPSLTGRRPRST